MALVKDTTYTNVFYDHVLQVLRSKIQAEFGSSPVYISPIYAPTQNFSIRIWGSSDVTENILTDQWTKRYSVDLVIYQITQNPDQKFWENFYQYSERLYELIQNNYNLSGTFGWKDGIITETNYLEYSDEEDEIEDLYPIKMSFSCLLSRSN